jgi:hypothetical protein
MISHLVTSDFKVEVAGNTYGVRPYNLGVMCNIAKHFESKGKDGLNYVADTMFAGAGSSDFIEVLIETVYFLIETDKTIEEFKQLAMNEKNLSKLAELLNKLMGEANPIYQEEQDNSGKKKVLGAVVLMFSMIGLIYSIHWLVGMAGHYLNF